MFWYEEDVKRLENKQNTEIKQPYTIFYGSSSIRLWQTLEDDFKDLNAINLGFGGSTLAACVWFFDRIFSPYQPEKIVIYAGDNDIGDGKRPEEVFTCYQELVILIQKKYGNIPCYFISLKPSFRRWNLIESFKYANSLIENEIIKNNSNWHFINIFDDMIDAQGYPLKPYFDDDGLHLSAQGYLVWEKAVQEAFATTYTKI